MAILCRSAASKCQKTRGYIRRNADFAGTVIAVRYIERGDAPKDAPGGAVLPARALLQFGVSAAVLSRDGATNSQQLRSDILSRP